MYSRTSYSFIRNVKNTDTPNQILLNDINICISLLEKVQTDNRTWGAYIGATAHFVETCLFGYSLWSLKSAMQSLAQKQDYSSAINHSVLAAELFLLTKLINVINSSALSSGVRLGFETENSDSSISFSVLFDDVFDRLQLPRPDKGTSFSYIIDLLKTKKHEILLNEKISSLTSKNTESKAESKLEEKSPTMHALFQPSQNASQKSIDSSNINKPKYNCGTKAANLEIKSSGSKKM